MGCRRSHHPAVLFMSTTTSVVPSSWFRVRRYPHFDRPVSRDFAFKYATDPARVCRHSFLPFISYYKSSPRYKKELKKVVPKLRPISYAAHLDSHIYAYYAHRLDAAFEVSLVSAPHRDSVLAYRALGKCNVHFAAEAFAIIERMAPCTVFALDVTDFFGSLRHSILYDEWCRLNGTKQLPEDEYRVFKSITKSASFDREALYEALHITPDKLASGVDRLCQPDVFRKLKTSLMQINLSDRGIPQGSPISAVASNIFMQSFDANVHAGISALGGYYRRYCDDLLVVIPSSSSDDAQSVIQAAIHEHSLAVAEDKTDIVTFSRGTNGVTASEPLQYLGLTYDGHRILIRSKSLARFHARRRSAVKKAKGDALANSNNSKVYRRSLYERFTHLGRRNFISYSFRAADITNSPAIRRQIARHWRQLHRDLEE